MRISMHYVNAKTILSNNNGMNVYRGCLHGCIYCDSRSKCYGFTHEFEDIEVKINAPELLEKALKSKRKKCVIGTGAMSDPYIPIEDDLQITRKCLEIIDKYEFGAALLTKSARVIRDLELLKSINTKAKAVVQMTMTTYDEDLCRILEPTVSTTKERFKVLMECKRAGIPTIVWLDPLLPYINDTEENLMGILDYCVKAGVKGIVCFGMGLTLREGNREYFYQALDKNFPGLKQKYINEYGNSYDIPSPNQKNLYKIYKEFCHNNNIISEPDECFNYINEIPEKYSQISLFD